MGFRFRKSVKVLPGVRLNFSHKGAGASFGTRGARYSISPTGRRTTSYSIPGTGISFVESFSGHKTKGQQRTTSVASFPERKKTTVLILCLVFGIFGVHRFYTGKNGTGLLWLFTVGMLGIGWIVDMVMILLDRYKDALGRPLTQEDSQQSSSSM